MDDGRLREIEARANETVMRCVAARDCDAPARWQRQTMRGVARACEAHVGKRTGWRPIVALDLDALDLVAEFRRYDGEEDELLRQAATQAEHLQLDAEDRATRAERERDEALTTLAAVTAERDRLQRAHEDRGAELRDAARSERNARRLLLATEATEREVELARQIREGTDARVALAEREIAGLAELAKTLVDTFWPTINAKRIDLIERDIAGTITQAESALLAQFQAAAEVATRSFSAGLRALPIDGDGGAA